MSITMVYVNPTEYPSQGGPKTVMMNSELTWVLHIALAVSVVAVAGERGG